MKYVFSYLVFLIYVLGISSICLHDVLAQDRQNIDWSNPESINPLQEGIGDFLDTELYPYIQQAHKFYWEGEYRKAAQHFIFLLRHKYDNATTIYNLACCYGQMGEAKLVAQYLDRAIKAGFVDFLTLRKDKAYEKVWGDRYFYKVLKRLESLNEKLGELVYIKSKKLIKCHIRFPHQYNSQNKYPLLIGLHGNGGNPEDFVALYDKFKNKDFIFAAPQGAYRLQSDIGYRNEMYSWEMGVQDEKLWESADPLIEDYILNILSELSAKYSISNIYMMGFSQGTAYAYAVGIKHPDLITGIICFGGKILDMDKPYSLLSEEDIKKGKDLRVFIAHGMKDQEIELDASLKARDLLEKHQYEVSYDQFEGGHWLPPEMLNKAVKWMKK